MDGSPYKGTGRYYITYYTWMVHHIKVPAATISHITSVEIEGFMVYTGGDYGLHLNIMLLVQVWAYVMSDMLAHR